MATTRGRSSSAVLARRAIVRRSRSKLPPPNLLYDLNQPTPVLEIVTADRRIVCP